MAESETIRIAMWSGPRNISTAMMRAFENRPDASVVDEPFYAAYLQMTGLIHPMREAVLQSQPIDWRRVVETLTGPAPDGAPIFYQKHMTHHMLPGIATDWMDQCRNVFLIRDPARVIASYTAKWEKIALGDIGVVRQAELFDRTADRLGAAPTVIDSADVTADPRGMLTALCAAVHIPFSDAMLAWPAGRRATDGVWAPVWYDQVERSTGFSAKREAPPQPLPDQFKSIADAARPYYERLAQWRLKSSQAA